MTKLNANQGALLQRLLKGPLPRNALSRDILALIGQLGTVEEHGTDKLLFTVGTVRRAFSRPNSKHLTEQELSDLRHLLLASSGENAITDQNEGVLEADGTVAVVIDHHGAQFYRTMHGSKPEPTGKALPYDPHGFHRHLIHRKQANYAGNRVPEDPTFYKNIAQALKYALSIVVIGHGDGKSNAAAHLVEYLRTTHPDIAARIVALESADLSALSPAHIDALVQHHLQPNVETKGS